VVQHFNDDKPPSFVLQPQPTVFYLKGSIRQISPGKMEEEGEMWEMVWLRTKLTFGKNH